MRESLSCAVLESPGGELDEAVCVSQETIETLIVPALKRALTSAGPMPLYQTGREPGLFRRGRAGEQAAVYCQQQGWLVSVGEKRVGRNTLPLLAITPAGLKWLVQQSDARSALQALTRRLEAAHYQLQDWTESLHRLEKQLEQLRSLVQTVLDEFHAGAAEPLGGDILGQQLACQCLRQWQQTHPQEDCPLPELFRQIQASQPQLSVGQFHDCLRQLHAQGRIWLHPWAGPVFEIPEPEFALLVGHALVYYASCRDN